MRLFLSAILCSPFLTALSIVLLFLLFGEYEPLAIRFEPCVDTKFQVVCERKEEKPNKVYYKEYSKTVAS